MAQSKSKKPLVLRTPKNKLAFEVQAFLDTAGVSKRIVTFSKGDIIYSQGMAARHVYYLKNGEIKLSVVSKAGKEAIVAVLGPGDFFGEGCLAGQVVRMGTATAMTAGRTMIIDRAEMVEALHDQPALSERFIMFMLSRNIRIEENLIDQLFNSSEKRLARTLLLLARYGSREVPQRVIHNVSQETLAEIVGTTRPRVNFFMNKFRKLGFIKYNGSLQINSSLLSVVLHE